MGRGEPAHQRFVAGVRDRKELIWTAMRLDIKELEMIKRLRKKL